MTKISRRAAVRAGFGWVLGGLAFSGGCDSGSNQTGSQVQVNAEQATKQQQLQNQMEDFYKTQKKAPAKK